MRLLIQRVSQGRVTVDGQVVGEIGTGLVLLVGITHEDDAAVADKMAKKVALLRIFEDDDGKTNRSLLDVGGAALVVSQFTLYADTRKGRRPSFIHAARPEQAEPLVEHFMAALRNAGIPQVEGGRFGAMMRVELVNEGPFTIWLESE